MARSTEQAEKGSLSPSDTSTPGLLISGSECKLLELLSGPVRPPPVVTTVAGAFRVSLACLLFLSGGIVLLAGALATLAGTLDGIVPVYTELMGSFDGVIFVGTVEGIAAVDFVLMGNLEDMVFTGTGLTEGTELVVTELVGTPSLVLRQVTVLAWSPAPFAKADPVSDRADTVTPGKRFVLGAIRGRGWKETVGDTGP